MSTLKDAFRKEKQKQALRLKANVAELRALDKIADALDTLDAAGQKRVVRRLAKQVGLDAKAPARHYPGH